MEYQIIIDDFIGDWGYSKQYVKRTLSAYKGRPVNIKISSYGGSLDHGLDIRQQLVDHGNVTVYLSGFVASSATVIAMGAKKIIMSKYAMFLVHKCSNFIDAWGSYNADQMQELINELTENKKENDKIDVVLAQMYATRCNKKISEILDILKAGRWLTAQEAFDLGFVDELDESSSCGQKLNLTPELKNKFNAFGLSTAGIVETAQDKHADDTSDDPVKSNPQTQPMNKKKKFTKVENLLALQDITADNDGYVSVTEEQFENINSRLETLESENDSLKTNISKKDAEITDLKNQVENLKKAPGDESGDVVVENPAGTEDSFSAHDVYNQIKSIL